MGGEGLGASVGEREMVCEGERGCREMKRDEDGSVGGYLTFYHYNGC
jgi:hypothetical protein